jgi:hypothetical protein
MGPAPLCSLELNKPNNKLRNYNKQSSALITEGLKWEGTRKEELRAAFVQPELELDRKDAVAVLDVGDVVVVSLQGLLE